MSSTLPWLLRAWLATALVDGLFASVLSVAFSGSTATRMWQGVASTVLGREALEGGTPAALVGVGLHLGVALGWSAVFLLLVQRWAGLRRVLGARGGVLAVAAAYGPLVWLVMSLAVIPLLTGRPPSLTARWWVQLLGHAPCVGLPIVALVSRGVVPRAGTAAAAGAPLGSR